MSLVDTICDAIHHLNMLKTSSKLSNESAIVFDIDDTILDGAGNSIRPTCVLYSYAYMLGVNIFIITSRINHSASFTSSQLKGLCLPAPRIMYFKQNPYADNFVYKESARKSITDQGFDIIMSVGDQPWDYSGKYTGYGVQIK
jgi:predicted secreted acid phosphatase